MTKIIGSATGLHGCLIYIGNSEYRIRFYNNQGFDDVKIAHWDLEFQITDSDAYLYEDDEGQKWLDHAPETLGIENGS